MKKIIAMLVAIVMCASVLAVAGSAAWTDYMVNHLPSGVTSGINYIDGGNATWVHKNVGDGDLSNFYANQEGEGHVRGTFTLDMHEWDTYFITYMGGSYGTSGVKMNGIAVNDCTYADNNTTLTTEKAKAAFTFYTNGYGTGSKDGKWDSWKKLTVAEVTGPIVDENSNCYYWFFWFTEDVTTDAILMHYSSNYSGHAASDATKIACGGPYLNYLYDTNGAHSESTSGDDEPSTDTGDMLTVSIAVASVAILGTAAAIVMKKRKEN